MSERVITLRPADAACREAVLAYVEAVSHAMGLGFSVDPQGPCEDVELEGGQEICEALVIRWQLPDPPASEVDQIDEWEQFRGAAAGAAVGRAARRLERFDPTTRALARSTAASASLLDRMRHGAARLKRRGQTPLLQSEKRCQTPAEPHHASHEEIGEAKPDAGRKHA